MGPNRLRQRLRQRARGAVAVVVAVVLGTGVLLGACAMVIDVGSLYAEKEQLVSGADAAALAVAGACFAGSCASSANVAVDTAKKYANANAKDGRTEVTKVCGNWGALDKCDLQDATKLSSCIGDPPAGNYVEVRVRTEMPGGSTVLPPTFAAALAGNAGYRGTTVVACSRSTGATSCVIAAEATYKHTFDGAAGKAWIAPVRPLCPGEEQWVTLVSYTAPDANSGVPQDKHDSQSKRITSQTPIASAANPGLSFIVTVPECYNQVDFIFARVPVDPLVRLGTYGDTKIGSPGEPGNRSSGPKGWYDGGSGTCSEPEFGGCSHKGGGGNNSRLQVDMTNRSTARYGAWFTVIVDGVEYPRQYVAPGETVKLDIPADPPPKQIITRNERLGTVTCVVTPAEDNKLTVECTNSR